jgi:hypothetical protein
MKPDIDAPLYLRQNTTSWCFHTDLAVRAQLCQLIVGDAIGTTYRLVEMAEPDPRRPKYSVSAERIPDGQGFKFTSNQVAQSLQKGMRDVTPKGQ